MPTTRPTPARLSTSNTPDLGCTLAGPAPERAADTPIANSDHPAIAALIENRDWRALPPYERIGAVYAFVRDEIAFGYNADDARRASDVLADGYGQCNTKGNLLFTLLRAVGIPVRFHGFTIDKALQRGAVPEGLFQLAPSRILHSWVEVHHDGAWLALEGFILDAAYLEALQTRFPTARAFCGYGAATPDLQNPSVQWTGGSTYIQKEGIADDFGLYDTPDAFYAAHGTNLTGLRRFLYRHVFRHIMNWNVRRLRGARPKA